MNTNARSLCPKLDSFIDNFDELQCTFAVVTETWVSDDQLDLSPELQDRAGLSIMCLNRKKNRRGVAHGGVGIVSKDSRARVSRVKLHNPGEY